MLQKCSVRWTTGGRTGRFLWARIQKTKIYIYMVLFDLYYWNPGYLSRSWGATKNSTHDVSQTTVSSVLMDHGCCSCRPCWSEGWQLGHWKDQKRLVEYHCSTTLQRRFSELMSGYQTRDEFIASKGDPPATNLCLLHNLYPMYPNCLDDETTSCNPRD